MNKILKNEKLIKEFDILQEKFGSVNCNSVYGGGKDNKPDLCLVFMNPTAKNIATNKEWKGIRCQWLGTKQVWNFLANAGLFDKDLNNQIQNMRPKDWSPKFCKEVYDEVAKQGLYITNLAKCTQDDARPLPDKVFKEYRDLLLEEIKMVNPKKIILFGNQVSSIVLNKKISVSEYRKRSEDLVLGKTIYKCYPVYYPVGNGFFNTPKAIEDIKYIVK